MNNDELMHFGILGMRWGVRRYQPYSVKPRGSGKGGKEIIKETKNESLYGRALKRNYQKRQSKADKAKNKFAKTFYQRKADEAKADYEHYQKSKEWDEQHPKAAIAKKVVQGAAIAGMILGTAYVIKSSSIEFEILKNNVNTGELLSNLPINKLKSSDEMLKAGTKLQRIVRGKNFQEVMQNEKAKNLIWATRTKNDNAIYKTMFNARGAGSKWETSRTVTKDLIMPSERKRVIAFMGLIQQDPKFRESLANEVLGVTDPNLVDKSKSRRYYELFMSELGNEKSKARVIYFDKLAEMGYNAVRDDLDTGILGRHPTILLDASNTTVIDGAKKVSALNEIISTFKINPVDIAKDVKGR